MNLFVITCNFKKIAYCNFQRYSLSDMKISISHEIRFFATAKIFYQIDFAIKKNNEADKIPINGTNHEN